MSSPRTGILSFTSFNLGQFDFSVSLVLIGLGFLVRDWVEGDWTWELGLGLDNIVHVFLVDDFVASNLVLTISYLCSISQCLVFIQKFGENQHHQLFTSTTSHLS